MFSVNLGHAVSSSILVADLSLAALCIMQGAEKNEPSCLLLRPSLTYVCLLSRSGRVLESLYSICLNSCRNRSPALLCDSNVENINILLARQNEIVFLIYLIGRHGLASNGKTS